MIPEGRKKTTKNQTCKELFNVGNRITTVLSLDGLFTAFCLLSFYKILKFVITGEERLCEWEQSALPKNATQGPWSELQPN